ncbi:hypothetical protein EGW76_13450 [Enterococcus gallinarum]|uniref:beta-1,6-N-acetylglucosaminyltransferase n=1 Tax=Enterococcus gallinarum TaxID=1353 RepID=UPI000F4E0F58|nr:beta-1,6-N-acetylglucosaminyltransferase [Enterococcus gallinarum]ROY85507.1 hypothetical protein EGW76_13450 [Enterococcus gallinarum]
MVRKQAYLILAHNKPEIFNELLKSLDLPQHDIYVHIDKATPIDEFILIKSSMEFSNVFFLEKRFDIRWGSYEIVRAEMELLKTARSSCKYSYFHLLSGVDALIENKIKIYNYYEANYGIEYIHFWNLDEMRKSKYCDRYNYYDVLLPKKRNTINKAIYHLLRKFSITLQKIAKIKRNSNINFYMGSQWFSITDQFADYLISKEKEIEKIFRNTLCPDESFLQTFFMNSYFNKNLIKNMDNDYSKIKRDIEFISGTPKIWKEDDIDRLLTTSNFFARKFDDWEVVKQISDVLKNEGEGI